MPVTVITGPVPDPENAIVLLPAISHLAAQFVHHALVDDRHQLHRAHVRAVHEVVRLRHQVQPADRAVVVRRIVGVMHVPHREAILRLICQSPLPM